MKATATCIPCIINQVFLGIRKATPNQKRQHQILIDLIKWTRLLDFNRTPPEIAYDCFQQILRSTGIQDPFKYDKKIQNKKTLRLEPKIRQSVNNSADRLLTALKLSIAGNAIDSLFLKKDLPDLKFDRIIKKKLGINNYSLFKKSFNRARTILYIFDNCGESVFDKIVIEKFIAQGKEVIGVVRSKPALNDVLLADARIIGLHKLCRLINPGVGSIGLPLHLSSARFKRIFRQADLVISKGQANFESLERVKKDSLFFLFMIKCQIVAKYLGVKKGSYILLKNSVLRQR